MIEDEIKQSKINALKIRIEALEIQYRDLSNEGPIDVSTELKKIRQVVTELRFGEATRLSNQLQNTLQQRNERYKEVVQTINDQIVTDIAYFESNP